MPYRGRGRSRRPGMVASPRPMGTQLYVPGFLSDMDQHRVDQQNLGIAILPIISATTGALSLIKKSAAGPNRDAAAQCYPEAARGNLSAVAAFIVRSRIHTVSSAQPWQTGLAQLQQQHPELVAAAQPMTVDENASWQIWGALQPNQVYSYVRSHAIMYKAPSTGTTPTTPTQPPPVSTQPVPTLPPPTTQPPPVTVLPPNQPVIQPVQPIAPQPPSQLPGGDTNVTITAPGTTQAGMFGNLDLKQLMIPGLILAGIMLLTGKR